MPSVITCHTTLQYKFKSDFNITVTYSQYMYLKAIIIIISIKLYYVIFGIIIFIIIMIIIAIIVIFIITSSTRLYHTYACILTFLLSPLDAINFSMFL